MKKIFTLLSMMFLFTAASVQADDWVKTEPSALQTGDVVVIVDLFKVSALPSDKGTSGPPTFTAIALNGDQTKLASEPAENLQWDVTVSGSNCQFAATGTENYLYCTNSNNGVRVGSGENNVFTFENNSEGVPFLKNVGQTRYLGVYLEQDWRCYTTITQNNIKDTKIAFYKKTASTDPRTATVINFTGDYKTNFTYGPDGDGVQLPTATVSTSAGATVAGATVTWTAVKESGNEELVPTISGNKVMIPNHSYGKVKVSAAYEGNTTYQPSSKSYTINVFKGRMNIAEILEDFQSQVIEGGEDWKSGIPTSYWQVNDESGTPVGINATVTYANGSYTYIQDENGDNLLLFKSGLGYVQGDVINGIGNKAIYGNLKTYNGLLELEVTDNQFTKASSGAEVSPKTIYPDVLGNLENMNAYLKIENAIYMADLGSKNYTFKVGGAEFTVRQQWTNVEVDGLEVGAIYTLEGMGAVYNTTPQLYLVNWIKTADSSTGITTINGDKAETNGAVYNVAGQRVNKDYKGVVIVNGKKVINK